MERWVPFFIILGSVALTVQAIVVISAYVFIKRRVNLLENATREVLIVLKPIPVRIQAVIEIVQARMPAILSEAEHVARLARIEVQHADRVLTDVMDRFHSQAAHLDHVFTSALDAVEHTGSAVRRQVSWPFQAVRALAHGVQAGIRVYRGNHRDSATRFNISEQDRHS